MQAEHVVFDQVIDAYFREVLRLFGNPVTLRLRLLLAERVDPAQIARSTRRLEKRWPYLFASTGATATGVLPEPWAPGAWSAQTPQGDRLTLNVASRVVAEGTLLELSMPHLLGDRTTLMRIASALLAGLAMPGDLAPPYEPRLSLDAWVDDGAPPTDKEPASGTALSASLWAPESYRSFSLGIDLALLKKARAWLACHAPQAGVADLLAFAAHRSVVARFDWKAGLSSTMSFRDRLPPEQALLPGNAALIRPVSTWDLDPSRPAAWIAGFSLRRRAALSDEVLRASLREIATTMRCVASADADAGRRILQTRTFAGSFGINNYAALDGYFTGLPVRVLAVDCDQDVPGERLVLHGFAGRVTLTLKIRRSVAVDGDTWLAVFARDVAKLVEN